MAEWNFCSAAHDDAYWFFMSSDAVLKVIAPPGVRVVSARYEPDDCALSGWRYAEWRCRTDTDIFIDIDQPSLMRELSTAEVVDRVGSAHSDTVRKVMLGQLAQARAFVGPWRGEFVKEEYAHATAATTAWILSELMAAFPDGGDAQFGGGRASVFDRWDELIDRLRLPVAPSPDRREAAKGNSVFSTMQRKHRRLRPIRQLKRLTTRVLGRQRLAGGGELFASDAGHSPDTRDFAAVK